MGYTDDPTMVRVDIFKNSGKWYTTLAIEWLYYSSDNQLIHDIFRESLKKHLGNKFSGMTAVCLEPYHEYSHPLMIKL